MSNRFDEFDNADRALVKVVQRMYKIGEVNIAEKLLVVLEEIRNKKKGERIPLRKMLKNAVMGKGC